MLFLFVDLQALLVECLLRLLLSDLFRVPLARDVEGADLGVSVWGAGGRAAGVSCCNKKGDKKEDKREKGKKKEKKKKKKKKKNSLDPHQHVCDATENSRSNYAGRRESLLADQDLQEVVNVAPRPGLLDRNVVVL